MDGNVAGMSLEERGAYITLLCLCWQESSLPADTKRLARMVGTPERQFLKFWPAVRGCFRDAGDRLVHPRLEKERAKQAAYREKQRQKGIASAVNRGSTAVQPRFNRGSTGPPTGSQPEGNSPISDLRSPRTEASASVAAPAPAGAPERLMAAFRAHWKDTYGYECSLILKPLEFMQLEQQLVAHPESQLLAALDAYFVSADAYVRRAKHPLMLFLRDPVKHLAHDTLPVKVSAADDAREVAKLLGIDPEKAGIPS